LRRSLHRTQHSPRESQVHDGSWNGIYSGAGFYQLRTDRFGYVDNVVIAGVASWNHHKSGVDFPSTYHKQRTYPTTNVRVLASSLHDNGADGVVMGPVQHGLIDGNECAFNGRLRDARLGCWTWDPSIRRCSSTSRITT
jgi:hypothetical protein